MWQYYSVFARTILTTKWRRTQRFILKNRYTRTLGSLRSTLWSRRGPRRSSGRRSTWRLLSSECFVLLGSSVIDWQDSYHRMLVS